MCYQCCYWIYINMSCSHVINSLLFYIEPDMRKLYHPRLNTHTHTSIKTCRARRYWKVLAHKSHFLFSPSFMVAVISAIILFITSSHFRGKFFIAHNCRDTRWKIVRRIFTHWIFITGVILVTRYICSDDSRDCPNLCQLALEDCLWSWPSI